MSSQVTTLRMEQKFKKTPAGEIPIDWAASTVGNVAEINPDTLGDNTSPDRRLRYIDISSIERTGKIRGIREIIFKSAPSRARRLVKFGDILVSTVRPYLRAFARVTEPAADLVASTGFAVIRPLRVDGEYLYQHIVSDPFVKWLEGRMTGSNYPAVNPGDVAECTIPLPPPDEQTRIAEILSAVDDAIEKTSAVIEKTRALKKALLHRLFTRGIGHNAFRQTEVGRIPESWQVVSLGDLVSIKHGWPFKGEFLSEDPNASLVVVCIGNFRYTGGFRFDATPVKTYTDSCPEEYRLSPSDTLLVMTCQTPGGEILGIPGRIPDDGRVYLHNQRMGKVVVTERKAVDQNYLYWLFLSPSFNRHLVTTASGTKVLHTAPERIESFRFGFPKVEEQKQIADTLESVEAEERSHEKERDKLNDLKSGLMSVLLTGRIRVTVKGA